MDLAKISGRRGFVGSYRIPSTSPASEDGPSINVRAKIKKKGGEREKGRIVQW